VEDSQSQATSQQSQHSSHQTSQSIDSAEQIEVDFKSLNAKTKRSLDDESDAVRVISSLQKLVLDVDAKFSKLQAPSIDADERFVRSDLIKQKHRNL
jgi:hypothetical protein